MYELATGLKIPLYAAVGIMEMLWHHAAQHAQRGDIGSTPDRAIAEAVGWDPKKAEILVDKLVDCGWLDRDPEYRLLIHDWPEHCEQLVKKWVDRNKKEFIIRPSFVHQGDINRQPSREAMAKAEAFVVSSSEEIKSEIPKPETAIAVLEHPTPLEILDELRPIYHRAGLPIAPKHEQLAIQALIDIPATKRHRVVDYVKNALLTGRWRGASTTKGLLNLLRDGDWDVQIVERTLPAAPVVDERIQRLRERRHYAAKS